MSRSRPDPRWHSASYRRRRRSPLPVVIFLAALVILVFVLFQLFRPHAEAGADATPAIVPSQVPSAAPCPRSVMLPGI